MDALWYHHLCVSSNSPNPPERGSRAEPATGPTVTPDIGAPSPTGSPAPLAPSAPSPPSAPSASGLAEPPDLPPDLAALVSQGQHATAAEQALARGLPGHAARLYEQLWDFARASAAARAAGDLPRALRCAVSARDEAAIGELVALLARDQAGQRTAADLLAQLRRHGDAAPLYEELGLADEAAQSYLRAHRDLDAARIYQQLGQDRRAGQILERALELATVDEKPSLQLALGQILSRRGAHAEAATFLQSARTLSLIHI